MRVSGKAASLASIAVHVVAIVAVAARWPAPRLRVVWRPPTPAARPAAPVAATAPLTVMLLAPAAPDERDQRGPDAGRLRAGTRAGPSHAIGGRSGAAGAGTSRPPALDGDAQVGEVQLATRGLGAPHSPAGETGGPAGTGSRGLGMRGPELRLGAAYLERAGREGHGGPSAPGRGFDPAPGGRGVIYDRVTTMTVERDGTAHLDDLPDVDYHWDIRLPTPDNVKDGLVHLGGELRTWYADPYARARVGRPQDVPAYLKIKPDDCDHWDDACSVELRGREEGTLGEKLARGQVGHGKAELSDLIMRHFVGDVYASRKLKLLDDTREARAVMGAAHRAEDRARSAELMRRNLEALWRAAADPKARRDALFAMWDECAEADGADGADGAEDDRADRQDRAEGEAGQRARALVIGWIRSHLPAGSPDAYPADELAAHQAHRQSRQPFTP